MKTYEGRREGHACVVMVNNAPLNPRLDLWNHSPTGFEWGYGGSGPAQLALALLADHLGNDEEAVLRHQLFKQEVVAQLDWAAWTLTGDEIARVLQSLPSQPRKELHGRSLHFMRRALGCVSPLARRHL